MITNSSKSSHQYLRKIMVLPVIFFIVTVVAVNCTSKDIKDVKNDSSKQKAEYLKENAADLKKGIDNSVSKTIDSQMMKFLDQKKKELIEKNKNTMPPQPETPPSFIGGQAAWSSFLQKNLNSTVPVDNGAPEGKYMVVTQFIVDKNGKISDLKAVTHFGYGMEEEVLRVMKLSPDWSPAIQKGHAVKAYSKQPITFVISAE